jgi:hypothetical protein
MRIVLVTIALVLSAARADAQSAIGRVGGVEAVGGYAAFLDEAPIGHVVAGGSARVHLSPRVSVGPEVIYMRGPDNDRDLFMTANMTFDFIIATADARRGTVNAFAVIGGGMMRHADRFGTRSFASTEGAVTGGGGVRVWISDRVYALGEARIGWEPHVRYTGGFGMVWRR